ncbi:MAG: hypothetical protein ACREAE_07470 [Nitrosopumilaceae archaeon]
MYERKRKAEAAIQKENFYQNKFRKDMTECLYQLYMDLKNSKNDRFKDDLPTDVKKSIQDSIIPPYAINKEYIEKLLS